MHNFINFIYNTYTFSYSKDIISPTFISGTNPLTCISPGKLDLISPSNFNVQCPKSFNVLVAIFPTDVTSKILSPIVNLSPTNISSFNTPT